METGMSNSKRGTSNSSAATLVKPAYEVVSPLGEPAAGLGDGKIAPAPLGDLNGKKIGLVWTAFTNGDVILEAFMDLLNKRFEGLEFVKLPNSKGGDWGGHPDESVIDVAKEAGIDAAILAVGG